MVRPGKRLSRNGDVECGSLREMKAGGGARGAGPEMEGRGGEERGRTGDSGEYIHLEEENL